MLQKQCRCLAIETHEVAHHADKARREHVAALTKQRIQRGGVVFQPGCFIVQREAHGRWLRGHAQLTEQARQQRIVRRVMHDEAGIDPVAATVQRDVMGVRMTAQIIAGFEDRDIVLAR